MRRSLAWLLVLPLIGCAFDVSLEKRDASGPVPDAVACPTAFTTRLADSTSQYMITSNEVTWRAAEALCEQQSTHLFVPTDNAEVTAMRALLDGERYWVGVAQMPGQSLANTGWLLVTGGAHTTTWQDGKPDDGGSENGEEQAGTINNAGLDDDNHRETNRYICECDGVAADAAVVVLLPP